MKQTVNIHEFRDAFYRMGRKDNFSYEGLEILFDYLEEFNHDIGEDIGEEIEFDVIALCCDYAESTIDELIIDYSIDISDCDPDDAEAIEDTVMEDMAQNTAVCGKTANGSIVYAQF